jgi:hypothetical protein
MLKQFKPKETPPPSREEISRLFQKGDFHSAAQQCRKAGNELGEFQDDIEAGARRLLLSHRPGELLSFIYLHHIHVQYEVPVLLKAAFDIGDYHGFLKNAHRFGIYSGLAQQINLAIEHLRSKGQSADAEAWARKFEVFREQSNRQPGD